MPGLLIKDFPPELHRKLKEQAAQHHRSMTRQALILLEAGLSTPPGKTALLLPQPLALDTHSPLKTEEVTRIIRRQRDQSA